MRAMVLAAGSAVAALQPPRLLLGTIGVAFIALLGGVLDAINGPNSLGGIDRPLTAEVAQARADELETFRRALPESVRPPRRTDVAPDLDELRAALLENYLVARTGLVEDSTQQRLEEVFRTGLGTLDSYELQGPFAATMTTAGTSLGEFVRSVLGLEPANALRELAYILYEIPAHLWRSTPIMAILIGLLLAFSLALFGGAISRLDAMDTGLNRKETAWTGLEFAWLHFGRFVQSLLVPIGIVALLTGALAILGIPFNLQILDILGGIFYFIAIGLGLLCAILLIGFGVLVPMLLGAVAVERSDAGDAIQRAWGALMTRPAHLALLLGVALVSFAVSLALVDLIVVLALDVAATSWGGIIHGSAVGDAGTFKLLDFTFNTSPSTTMGSSAVASALMGFWETLLTAIVLGYIFSWIATLGTRVFLGMRLIIDRQSPAVIWVPGSIGGTTIRLTDIPKGPFAAEDSFGEGDR